ncbi:MAG: hypothetical protein ACRDWE_10505, partial [Acidimicrobiales bacterium]
MATIDRDANSTRLVAYCRANLPPQEDWEPFTGYPNSLALAVTDAIWSMWARYAITRGVIQRYAVYRRSLGGNPAHDGLRELVQVYEQLGGSDQFIDEIGTRNRVSTARGASRKGEVVLEAAHRLLALSIDTADDFRAADGQDLGQQVAQTWRALPGQGSGISWRYLRMLAGLADVKPDRMVIRFVASSLRVPESAVRPDEAVQLVAAAAAHFGVDVRSLDHEIWKYQSGATGVHDQVCVDAYLREVAQGFLGAAFPALTEDHVLPPSDYDHHLWVARDYMGPDITVPESGELQAALNAAYPQRFGEPRNRVHPEFANHYVFSLLEAAIVRCAEADNVFEADTEPCRRSVDELIDVLSNSTSMLHCCRAVSHLTTASGEPAEIWGLTVYPESQRMGLVSQTCKLVPGTWGAFNRQDPRPYDPPHSLVVASEEVGEQGTFQARARLAQRVTRFLLLARLLYAGTHQSMWQVCGTSTLVSSAHPRYQVFEGAESVSIRLRRELRLSDSDTPAFAALDTLLDAAAVRREGMASTSFDLALFEYNRSFEPGSDAEQVVGLSTALEAILTGNDEGQGAIGFRLRSRAAALLATQDDPAVTVFDDIK